MNKWLERRRIAKEKRFMAMEKERERYQAWYNKEVRVHGHIRSYDEIQGWCIDIDCFKTAPHSPH